MSKKDSKEEEELSALCEYIRSLHELYDDVIKESYQESREEVRMLFEVLNNWIDAAHPLFKRVKLKEAINRISCVILAHLWRLSNWIIYEILTGHYFEALRDIRFLFESSLLAWHYDSLIDRKVCEKWGAPAKISLKAEIIELAERLRHAARQKRQKVESHHFRRVVERHVRRFVEKSDLTEDEKRRHIELYCEILTQPELYWSISKIIDEFAKSFNLEGELERALKSAWGELSAYTHFSRKFFNVLLNSPEEIWIEYYDEELLRKCCRLLVTTTDLFLSVLVIQFPMLEDPIRERIVDWWDKNFNVKLKIADRILSEIATQEPQ